MNTKRPRAEVNDAIERISQIHEHLAKGELYRGFRPVPVAVTALLGLAAAAAQTVIVAPGDLARFPWYWAGVALVCGAAGTADIAHAYLTREDRFARRRTHQVLGQIVPALLAGAAVTAALGRDAAWVPLLPGLWVVLFALGVFAARPYAPRATGWVALGYLLAGAWMLRAATPDTAVMGWRLGAVFAAGQAALALVLHLDLERANHAET